MIRNESLTFCPGGSYEPIWCSVVTGYSQDIFHFWPHPFSQKLQRTSCKWWQFIPVQRHQPGTELQPSSNLFVFKERVCERKVIGGDQLESDLERGARKLRPGIIPRWGRGSDNGDNGFDVARTGDPPPADLDWRDPSWLDAEMMTVTERIRDPECQTQDWCGCSQIVIIRASRAPMFEARHLWPEQRPLSAQMQIIKTW